MKRVVLILLVCLGIAVIWNWSLIFYGISQGIGQLRIVWNARPIEEVLKDPGFPDSLKQKLHLIKEIKRFAIDSLGLNDSENYQTIYDQKGEELMWVVTASEPFQLKPKTWNFPVVGSVPYKGFFDRDKALKELRNLEAEGWDVGMRNPGGWSTLGWFTDPILSGMLSRNEGDLASLIIHEMVHASVFIKDSVEFNENFASFIADSAAYNFLAWKYGKDSPEYVTYVDEVRDYFKYSNHVLRGSWVLDSLYQSMSENEADSVKLKNKANLIAYIVSQMDTLTLRRYKIPRRRFKDRMPNNDYFLAYRRYQSKQSDFKLELSEKYKGSLKKMIEDYQLRFPFL